MRFEKAELVKAASLDVMACHNFMASISALDFAAINAAHDVESFGEPGYSIENGVATIKVVGLLLPETGYDLTAYGITGYDVIEKYLQNADEDEGVNSAVLDIDSGGGFVSGLSSALNAINAFTKPISTFARGSMYSAAYWLGSTPKAVTVNATSGVGSIGVYVEHFDESAALANEGVNYNIFKSGFWKGAFSSFRPLTERESARLQDGVDEAAKLFFDHVADARGLTAASIQKFEGDTFSAEKALSLSLIDEIRETKTMKVDETKGAAAVESTSAVASFTQEQVDALLATAVKEAADKAMAAAMAFADRKVAIAALEIPDDAKAVLSGDAYQDVSVAGLEALAATFPKSLAEQMNDAGGAGVGADRAEFAPKSKADDAAEANAAAIEKLLTLKKVM